MGGGLIQIAAHGSQDVYLTGNPQITYFKIVYRRHTNFAVESLEQTIKGSKILGNKVSVTVDRTGDLLSRMYIEWDVPGFFGTGTANGKKIGPNIGNTLLKNVLLTIGGEEIDRHYNHWLTVWSELTDNNPYGNKPNIQNGNPNNAKPPESNSTLYQNMSYNHSGINSLHNSAFSLSPQKAFVPLQFWFCRNPGSSLPLIALQYHNVKLDITFAELKDITDAGSANLPGDISDIKLWADHIYLDTDERRRFAQQSHEYLIEQIQQQTLASTGTKLTFNHPIKELIWTKSPLTTIAATTGPGTPSVLNASNSYILKLNSHKRMPERNRNYFTRTQIWQHHSGFGGTTVRDSIAVYSFALKPEELQPSGTCNFSRLDSVHLEQIGTPETISVYAINYNILRINSGMAGIAYKK